MSVFGWTRWIQLLNIWLFTFLITSTKLVEVKRGKLLLLRARLKDQVCMEMNLCPPKSSPLKYICTSQRDGASLFKAKIPVSGTWANAYQLILQQAACAMCKTAHICSWDLGSLSVLDALLIQEESLNNIWIVKHFVNKNLISVKTGKQCTHCDGYAKSNWTIKLNWEAQFHYV